MVGMDPEDLGFGFGFATYSICFMTLNKSFKPSGLQPFTCQMITDTRVLGGTLYRTR